MAVFKRADVRFGGAFAPDRGMITPNKGLTGVMMQNMAINYTQNVTRIYELGTAGVPSNVYYVGGRAQGTLAAGHVLGPAISMKQYYEKFSDPCEAGTNDIQMVLDKRDCNARGGGLAGILNRAVQAREALYTAKFCVLISIGMQVQAEMAVINESSQLMFSSMDYAER